MCRKVAEFIHWQHGKIQHHLTQYGVERDWVGKWRELTTTTTTEKWTRHVKNIRHAVNGKMDTIDDSKHSFSLKATKQTHKIDSKAKVNMLLQIEQMHLHRFMYDVNVARMALSLSLSFYLFLPFPSTSLSSVKRNLLSNFWSRSRSQPELKPPAPDLYSMCLYLTRYYSCSV